MNAEISETIRNRVLGVGMQILGLPAQPVVSRTDGQTDGQMDGRTDGHG